MKYSFCPTLLEKFEYLRTNGQSKAGVSIGKTCSFLYTYARILSQKVCLRYRIEKRDLSSLTGPEKSVPLLC